MAAEKQDKTERATPKKRRDSRKKGEVAQSKEVVSMIIFATALLAVLSALGTNLTASVATQAQSLLSGAEIHPRSLADFNALFFFHIKETAKVLLPILFLFMLAGVIGNVIQIGFLFTTEPLGFKLSRLSLIAGAKRFVSLDRIFDLVKALIKMVVAFGATWIILGPALNGIAALADASVWGGIKVAGDLCKEVAFAILVAFSSFALIDFFYTRARFEKKLRMTKQEIRDEVRQRDGDPKIKGKRKAMQKELSRLRMIAEVSQADVVITNPTHFAVALRYDRGAMGAPKVVAKGRNHLAKRIREEARKHLVPIVENPPLAQLLYKTASVNREIPEALFQAVAEVLAYITRLDPRRAEQWSTAS
jgi:flagellar biosynthetic protein FlhB